MATNNSTNNWSPLTTKGDLFTYGSAPARLAIGSNYYFPQADSTQTVGISYQLPIFQPQICIFGHNDFVGNSNGDLGVNSSSAGTGASTGVAAWQSSLHPGNFKLDMGTTTTGWAALLSGANQNAFAIIGSTTIILETCIYLSALSNGTDTYTFYFGTASGLFHAATPTDGVYVSYSSGANSGNFILTARAASTSTTTNTSTTWTGAASWYKLRLVITSTLVTLYGAAEGSDFTSLGTVNSNIPTTALFPWFIEFDKSAGTTDTFGYVDYVRYQFTMSSTR